MLKLDTNPPLDQNAEEAPPAAFVSTEKSPDRAEPPRSSEIADAPTGMSPIDEAFAACRAVGGGQGAFGDTWINRLLEVVQPAYRVFHLAHDKPAELARLARLAEIRFTAATEKNLALLCVKLAARPNGTDQDKVCSDWATMLHCALAQNILPDGFVGWADTTTVAKCKAAVAKEKAEARAKAGQPPRKRPGEEPAGSKRGSSEANNGPRLELHLNDADGCAEEAVALSPMAHMALLDALTARGSQAERLSRMAAALHALAEALTVDEAAANTPPAPTDAADACPAAEEGAHD